MFYSLIMEFISRRYENLALSVLTVLPKGPCQNKGNFTSFCRPTSGGIKERQLNN